MTLPPPKPIDGFIPFLFLLELKCGSPGALNPDWRALHFDVHFLSLIKCCKHPCKNNYRATQVVDCFFWGGAGVSLSCLLFSLNQILLLVVK